MHSLYLKGSVIFNSYVEFMILAILNSMAILKKRLDLLVNELYPHLSRAYIQTLIKTGSVKVDGIVTAKPGTFITDGMNIEVAMQEPRYVSRAGFKLEAALNHFNIDVKGLSALDAGLSTGGFTDCWLQHGVAHVVGVDVGTAQVHPKIAQDPRVTVLEKTNLRDLRSIGHLVDVVTLDLSFISVLKVMDAIKAVLKVPGDLIILIKPQFEVGKELIGRGGIVKDSAMHEEIVEHISQAIIAQGFELIGVIPSPIKGADGNQEFLAYFKRIKA